MDSFFSGTDMRDLEINAPKNNVYLSLIVNNKEQMVAKLCFVANTGSSQTTAKALDEFGQEYVVSVDNENQQYLVIYDCDIDIERAYLREDFIEAVEDIMKVPTYGNYSYGSNHTYSNNYGSSYNSNYNNGTVSSYSKSYSSITPTTGKSIPVIPSTATFTKKKRPKKDVEKDYYITNTIPEFAVNVLISFADRVTFKDFMDVLDFYTEYEIAPKLLQEAFFDNFETTYAEYFPNVKSDEGFKTVLEALLEEYEDFLTAKPSKYNKYIEVLIEAIEKMINKI